MVMFFAYIFYTFEMLEFQILQGEEWRISMLLQHRAVQLHSWLQPCHLDFCSPNCHIFSRQMSQYSLYRVIFSLKVLSTDKLIQAAFGFSRLIYVNVDSPNLGFAYFNFLVTLYIAKCISPNTLQLCNCVHKCSPSSQFLFYVDCQLNQFSVQKIVI